MVNNLGFLYLLFLMQFQRVERIVWLMVSYGVKYTTAFK